MIQSSSTSNPDLLWKQTSFVTATGYAKAITELSKQPLLTPISLLLGAHYANTNEEFQKPIEALTRRYTSLKNVAIKLGISIDNTITPIQDKTIPMDDDLKALLQRYRKTPFEYFIDALIDKLNYDQGYDKGISHVIEEGNNTALHQIDTPTTTKSIVETINQFLHNEGVINGLLEDDEENDGTLSSQRIALNINEDKWGVKIKYTPSTITNNALITLKYTLKKAFTVDTAQELFITSIGARMNNKLRIGGFGLDMSTGDFSYNTGFFVPPNGITVDSIEENNNFCLTVLQTYAPIMKRYILSTTDADIVGDYLGALDALDNLS